MFVDEVTIKLEAGKGGDGCTAFRREKYVPDGGPDGGNGGRGANIIFKVDEGLRTLLDLRYRSIIKGRKGENGSGKNKTGAKAEDIIIKVPLGTVVKDVETGFILADLTHKNDEVIVAKGGRGGRGNRAFATASNPAPDISENGEPGEVKTLKIELKLLADVGLVGLPSVGKSTILSMISASKPKIAAYHFTTLSPNLGVVKTTDNRSFVVADLPGLIEGASQGEGLGDRFLRHIERTRVIAHIIDMSGYEGRDPYDDYVTINNELKQYNAVLLDRPQIVVANKMDIEGATENLEKFKSRVDVPVYEISAIQNKGLDKVLIALADILDTTPNMSLYKEEAFESHVLYKFKKEKPFSITKEDDYWIVRGDDVGRLFKMTKFTSDEATLRFARKLKSFGIDDELKRLGAEDGDIVKIMNYNFEYRE
ncbi:MAG: GTPase ObgE [Bacilli bacterium]|nr:GTPase ObgE [Bacilli bacterium]MDD3304777.1 GTPase ObgE [Bacilli bacterium]MDD4053799.1 GTPase ObgE [Bacilli bacterium]MDD4411627.1 GTPase ObgE [Bacilli bacterium]